MSNDLVVFAVHLYAIALGMMVLAIILGIIGVLLK